MADIKQAWSTSAALTITLTTLAHSTSAGRESTAVDNSTNKYIDAMLTVSVKITTGTSAADKAVYVYVYGSEDGTNYDTNATGSDAAITLESPTNLRLLDVISVNTTAGNATWKKVIGSVASAFGGQLPRKWGIVILNTTSLAFTATSANHSVTYSGMYYSCT